jgi:hypothetical protein
MTYDVGNPGQAQKCRKVKPVNQIATFPLFNDNIDDNK